jgi:hypothetical protein
MDKRKIVARFEKRNILDPKDPKSDIVSQENEIVTMKYGGHALALISGSGHQRRHEPLGRRPAPARVPGAAPWRRLGGRATSLAIIVILGDRIPAKIPGEPLNRESSRLLSNSGHLPPD